MDPQPSPFFTRALVLSAVAFLCASLYSGLLYNPSFKMQMNEFRARFLGETQPELPRFGSLPEFSFTSHTETEITLDSLKGRPWLINLFFTSCPHICPTLMKDIGMLRRSLKLSLPEKDFGLLSITVDAKRDNPKRMREYRDKLQLNFDDWLLVTGEDKEIKNVLDNGLKLGAPVDINVHSKRIVLIDREGIVRGFYSIEAPEDIIKLKSDLGML